MTTQDYRERRMTFDLPVLIDPLIRAHRRGAGDPTHRRLGPGHWLRASGTPEGPVLVRLAGDAGLHSYVAAILINRSASICPSGVFGRAIRSPESTWRARFAPFAE